MDDNILSQKIVVISNIINKIRKLFVDLSVVRGNKDTFLGINTEIKEHIIKIHTVKQLEECIKHF